MTTPLHTEHLKLGRYLWERINATDNHDAEALRALGDITFDLMEAFGGKYVGFMHQLNMWVGLKQDAPEGFRDYGEGVKETYPEFFKDPPEQHGGT